MFSDILKKIKYKKNIELFNNKSKKYNQDNLIINSKVVITKPSSIIDISLYFDKKVIVHDYESNFKILIKDFINYGNYDIFANSFNELNLKLKRSIMYTRNYNKINSENYYFFQKNINYDIKNDIKYLEKSF